MTIAPILPDLILASLGFVILSVDLVWPRASGSLNLMASPTHTATFHVAWLGLIGVLILLGLTPETPSVYLNNYQLGPWSQACKGIFVLAALGTVWLSKPYFQIGGNARGVLRNPGEFYAILVFCTLGMFALVSARELVTFFVGLELATIPLFILTAFYRKDPASAEASTKYIIMGGLSSGFLLFGFSFLYGAANSLEFEMLKSTALADPAHPFLRLGTLFVLGGLGFKLAMAPFHMWAPDVYQGAPTPVTAFISVGSKAAGLSALMLLFFGPLEPMRASLTGVFAGLACLSMVAGNLGALKQMELRRFLAYSSIAQIGYFLVAMTANRPAAAGPILYYLLAYGTSSFCFFFLISIIGRRRPETFASLRGLSRQSPLLASILMLTMFSLAGIPPLAGFLGKFLVFSAAAGEGHYYLVLFATLNSVVSLYYYLQVVREAYITEPEAGLEPLEIDFLQRWALILTGAGIVLLGIWPGIMDYVFRLAR